MSCNHAEEPDYCSNHHHKGCQSHPSSSCECSAPGGGCIWNFVEARWDARYPANQDVSWVEEGGALPPARFISPEGVVWPKQAAVHALLAELHDIFSLEPAELGCTDIVKHEIRVVDDEPFKERFQRISPPMVDKAHAHMKEMLEVGVICSSQSPWCNTVVLVCKKEGGLCFCNDFCKLNTRTKKDSYLLPQIQEAIESLVDAGYFSYLDLKVGFWQIAIDKALKQYTAFTVGELGVLWV